MKSGSHLSRPLRPGRRMVGTGLQRYTPFPDCPHPSQPPFGDRREAEARAEHCADDDAVDIRIAARLDDLAQAGLEVFRLPVRDQCCLQGEEREALVVAAEPQFIHRGP